MGTRVAISKHRFLSAEWRYLLMLNFTIDPAALKPFVPAGTELDFFQERAYVSVVAFLFRDTRLLGIPVPFHRNFEEINLRFYVRRQGPDGWRRGVVFIKEVVPLWAIAAVAVWVYNENYVHCRMQAIHTVDSPANPNSGSLEYRWQTATGWNSVSGSFAGAADLPTAGSEEEFITEHYWGYARQRNGGCVEYEVSHPQWRVWPATNAQLQGDMASFYGDSFGAALRGRPTSAFIADGSPVVVYRGTRIC